MYNHNTTEKKENQVFLEDYKKINGKVKKIKWDEHKMLSQELSESYKRLGAYSKSYRVSECGSMLSFKRFEDGSKKLEHANFCKVRLCPMCAWRRSLKIFAQVSRIMDAYDKDGHAYLFLTLTCRNVPGDELAGQIDKLFAAFKVLQKNKGFKKNVLAWFRCLEVTHNLRADTYHPHFHVILSVKEFEYFGQDYLCHDDWVLLWQVCLGVDYKPIVDIRRFRPSKAGTGKEVAEVAKYAAKPGDYLIHYLDDTIYERKTDETVAILDNALANRRLVAFGGEFKKLHKLLNLDDTEDGDLVHTDDDALRDDMAFVIENYSWHVGYRRYLQIELEGGEF